MSTDERDWPEPGETHHSFWNPAGPFRPLRRWLWYGIGFLLVVAVVLGAIGGLTQSFGWFFYGYMAGSLAGTLFTIEIALWFVDTVLAFLKR